MSGNQKRIKLFLRWHWARLSDGADRFVIVPGDPLKAITHIRRLGDTLFVNPGMFRPTATVKM